MGQSSKQALVTAFFGNNFAKNPFSFFFTRLKRKVCDFCVLTPNESEEYNIIKVETIKLSIICFDHIRFDEMRIVGRG